MNKFCNINDLIAAFNLAKKQTIWKESVQRYEMNLLTNSLLLQTQLNDATYIPIKCKNFLLKERGRIRNIKAQHISDRVVQRWLNDTYLLPAITKKLIYDNSASQKHKGISFARKRFELHLCKAKQLYKNNCYILQIDISKYFDNISHDIAIQMYEKYLINCPYKNQICNLIKILFNTFIDNENISTEGLSIGNQISQTTGLIYLMPIDNYCKIVKSIKFYGRYMDDIYIFANNKQFLIKLLNDIKNICQQQLRLELNLKKTKILKVTNKQYITWLKINYKFNNKLFKFIHKKTILRERRKLFKIYKLVKTNKMELHHFINCYKSWKGTYKKFKNKKNIYKMDKYFNKLQGDLICNKF